MAAIHDRLDPDTCDSNTSSNRQFQQLQQVQPDAAKRGITDGATAERQIEAAEMGTSEREDFGGSIG